MRPKALLALLAAGCALTTIHAAAAAADPSNPGGYPFRALRRIEANSLAAGPGGYLYGTSERGGPYGGGCAFRISQDGRFRSLHDFRPSPSAGSGVASYPMPAVAVAQDGTVYGMTRTGGTPEPSGMFSQREHGVVFEISPAGRYSVLCRLSSGIDDGDRPLALVAGRDGCLYGAGYTVFKVTAKGRLVTLHSFFEPSGRGPQSCGTLVEGPDGSLYGTTPSTVFRVTKAGRFTTLCTFGSSGSGPSSVVAGRDGCLYGASYYGEEFDGTGCVFRVSPGGTLTVLHRFDASTEGEHPDSPVAIDREGNLYGTLETGQCLYRVSPGGEATVLRFFAPGDPNGIPSGVGLAVGADGDLYGATKSTVRGTGTIFAIDPARTHGD
jgi:uncharacterized repeat protein (TIGR03803 family)